MKRIYFIIHLSFCVLYPSFAQITDGDACKINSCFTGGKSLSTPNSSLEDRDSVITWTETNVPAQRWIASDAGDNFFYLLNAYSQIPLSSASKRMKVGDKLIQQLGNDESSRWELVPVQDAAYPDAYYIRSAIKASGDVDLYIELTATTDGSRPTLQAKKATADSIRQMWRITVEDILPNRVTPALRDSVMRGFKDRFYKKANIGYILGDGGWWGDAEMIETILDAYETTGKQEYKTMFTNLYSNFTARNGTNWQYNEYNDDIAWMVIAATRGYLMFGDAAYLTHARTNFDQMYARALLPSGMLRWKETPTGNQGTNSCINGPAEVAACYLAIATKDESYYEKAKNLYALQRRYLYEPNSGKVFDAGTWTGETFALVNDWVSTYNQGTFLGAALMLYNHYGAAQYMTDAHKIVDWTKKDLCNARGIVRVCGSGNDLQGFKGILMRYLRRYIVDLAQPDKVEWMQRNALHAYNNRNSKGIIWTAWWVKAAENFIFTDNYNFANQPFGCSTAVSAAFNAPLSADRIIKNAFETIEAEHFDYLKGIYVEQAADQDSPIVTNTSDGYYTAYNHVEFGNETVTGMELLVQGAQRGKRVIEVRLDSLGGQLIATCEIPEGSNWTKLNASVAAGVTGRRHLYLVYRGTNIKLDHFRFTKAPNQIAEPLLSSQITIYPNPVIDNLNVYFPDAGRFSIYNAQGKAIDARNLPAGKTTLQVNHYISGVYLVNMVTSKGLFSGKFLKK